MTSNNQKYAVTAAAIAVYVLVEWIAFKSTGFLSTLSTNASALGTFKGQLGMSIALAVSVCAARPLMGYKIVPDWFLSRDWKWYGIACGGAVAIMVLSHVVHIVYHTDSSWMDKVLRGDGAGLLLMLIAAFVLAPINEEIVFRGVLFHALGKIKIGNIQIINVTIPILFSALAFMMVHGQYALPDRICMLILGLWFGWIRYKTNSLSIPIIAHACSGIIGVALYFSL